MAHITEIKIHGLLGRTKPIHLKLERDVNVFFGSNGSGKTTLLKVLDAAMSMDSNAIERLPVTRAEVHIFSLTENQVIKFVWDRTALLKEDMSFGLHDMAGKQSLSRVDQIRYLKAQRATINWKRTPPQPKNSQTLSWAHEFLPTTRLYVGQGMSAEQGSAKAKFSDDQLDAIFADIVQRAWLLFNARVSEQVRAIQAEGLRAVLEFVLTSTHEASEAPELEPKAAYASVQNFLRRQSSSTVLDFGSLDTFKRRYKAEPNLRLVVGNLNRVEQKIEKSIAPVERFKATLINLFSNGKTIAANSSRLTFVLDNGQELSPSSLSSGEKHLLKLLLTAMTAEENSVIIDEPELSMHIDWQRSFVSTVHALNPQCQLILATHSPEILAELADNKIFKI